MRFQGKITNWKDDQGFGFVIPNGGGQKAFVHVKAFENRSNRPSDGDLISYELATDEKGRFFAKNIRYALGQATSKPSKSTSKLPTIFAILFCILLALFGLIGRIPIAIVNLYFAISIITFLAYLIDKKAAKKNLWRTKENTLHLLSLAGGWPGALLAQKLLRHKSKKEEFQTTFWITVIANCSILGWLLFTKNGSTFLTEILSQVSKNMTTIIESSL
jgi:uncharacterized membrane protein YsdA (DUF1294 family)/cold shock CspA family protein